MCSFNYSNNIFKNILLKIFNLDSLEDLIADDAGREDLHCDVDLVALKVSNDFRRELLVADLRPLHRDQLVAWKVKKMNKFIRNFSMNKKLL